MERNKRKCQRPLFAVGVFLLVLAAVYFAGYELGQLISNFNVI